jgi:hypothetical protein
VGCPVFWRLRERDLVKVMLMGKVELVSRG